MTSSTRWSFSSSYSRAMRRAVRERLGLPLLRLCALALHVDAAAEMRPLGNCHARRNDVAVDGTAIADVDLLGGQHVAVDLAEHDHRLGVDLRLDLAIRADGQHVLLQLDLPLDVALDGEVLAAVQFALDDDGLADVHHVPLDLPPRIGLLERRSARLVLGGRRRRRRGRLTAGRLHRFITLPHTCPPLAGLC
jgi:hypothetical protein